MPSIVIAATQRADRTSSSCHSDPARVRADAQAHHRGPKSGHSLLATRVSRLVPPGVISSVLAEPFQRAADTQLPNVDSPIPTREPRPVGDPMDRFVPRRSVMMLTSSAPGEGHSLIRPDCEGRKRRYCGFCLLARGPPSPFLESHLLRTQLCRRRRDETPRAPPQASIGAVCARAVL
jgi:hypothetical protein